MMTPPTVISQPLVKAANGLGGSAPTGNTDHSGYGNNKRARLHPDRKRAGSDVLIGALLLRPLCPVGQSGSLARRLINQLRARSYSLVPAKPLG